MRKILISFLLGALVGAIVVASLLINTQKSIEQNPALEILDYVIAEWTSPPDSLTTNAAFFGGNKYGFKIGTIPDTVIALAKRNQAIYHIPWGVTCAQFVLESRWGICDLGANNMFGLTYQAVRKYMTHPAYVWRTDLIAVNGGLARRVPVRFAAFKSIAECFDTHAKYLRGSRLYSRAFVQNSPERFAREVAKHYAQDDQYALKLITIMRRYRLE